MNLKSLICVVALLLTTQFNASAQCSGHSVQIFSPNDTLCAGDTSSLIGLYSHSVINPLWILPSGQTIVAYNLFASSLALTDSGRYILRANYGSCIVYDTVYLKIGTYPQYAFLDINNNNNICLGDTMTLEIQPLGNYLNYKYALFGPGNNLLTNTRFATIPNTTVADRGKYTVSLSDTVGCYTDFTYYITQWEILDVPAAPGIFTSKNPVCAGQQATLTGNNSDPFWGYEWRDPNNTASYNKTLNINHSTSGKYKYYLYATNSICLSEPDSVEVEVQPNLSPTLSVSVSPGNDVGPYTPVTFTANSTGESAGVTYQWVKNGTNIPGATSKTLTLVAETELSNTDKVYVIMDNHSDCSTPDKINSNPETITINLGVNNLVKRKGLSVYPNPVNEVLNIKGLDKQAQFSVVNICGKVMDIGGKVKQSGDVTRINITNLPAGIYVLKAANSAVRFTVTR